VKCTSCGTEIEIVEEKTSFRYTPVDKQADSNKYNIPFFCTLCRAIKFPYRAIRDIVFIWPLLYYVENVKSDILVIPDTLKYSEHSDYGIILSHGPGYYDKKNKDKWKPVTGLSVGMKVLYDKSVPWSDRVIGSDGKEYPVVICSAADVSAEVIEKI